MFSGTAFQLLWPVALLGFSVFFAALPSFEPGWRCTLCRALSYGSFVLTIVAVHAASFTLGQSEVRRSLVVRAGDPIYRGVYAGECYWDGVRNYCATEVQNDR